MLSFGPFSFIWYISDLVTVIGSKIRSFADDTGSISFRQLFVGCNHICGIVKLYDLKKTTTHNQRVIPFYESWIICILKPYS